MATLADVFQELNNLKAEGVVREYALGGATAVAFYAEPTPTYDVDVFVFLPGMDESTLNPLDDRGFGLEAEHVMIHGVPVQFLPAYDALVEEAVDCALTHDYHGVSVRVISPEHLVALAFKAGNRRRRERAWLLIESGKTDLKRLQQLLAQHGIKEDVGNEK